MPIFRCQECGCAENTALCRYWEAHHNGEKELCSECDPKIGRWHNKFDKVKFKAEGKTMHDVIVDEWVASKFKLAMGDEK